jgi:transposase
MEEKHQRCAGLDVHRKNVVACMRIAQDDTIKREVRTFATTTTGLCELADWLVENGCTHAVMESTGVFWKPVWHILEGCAELLLANAQHVRNLPGRKSDINDATWLADLLAHGLIRSSFVPPEPIRELRDLTRTRTQLVGEKRRHLQRINKQLYDANIQITGVITDMLGTTGRAVLDAMVGGETDPEKLADLCHRLRKHSRADVVEALRGRITAHHRRLIKLHLELIDKLNEQIEAIEKLLKEQLRPFWDDVERLKGMPGVHFILAAVLLAEIGPDMHRFPTAGHLVSWAGLAPGQNESAGKKRSTRLRKGAPWLKTMLVQAAWGAVRTKGSYFRGLYYRIKARRGPQKAIVAVAAAMLRTAYILLRDKVPYQDIGVEHLKPRDKTKAIRRHVRRLQELGVEVEIKQAA